MEKKFTLVVDPDMDYEWLYVDGELEATGEPIDASRWLEILEKYANGVSERYDLTNQFCDRVDGNYNLIPDELSDFEDGDLL